jgi:hypothetical protein
MCKAPKIPKNTSAPPPPPPPPANPSAMKVQSGISGGGSEVDASMAQRRGKSMLKIPSMTATGISY